MSVSTEQSSGRCVFRVQINGPIDAVWRELTKTGEVQPAIFNNVMHTSGGVQPGSLMQMRSKDGKYVGMVGTILEVTPPHRFSHTLRFTHLDDPECVVVYELREKDGGTEFTLTVEKMPEGTKTGKSMMQGGPMICSTLKAVIEQGGPPLMTRVLFAAFGALAPITTPSKCKAEHWPLRA
jgi:uncharacterized protein YndB with AHSA1/START domain